METNPSYLGNPYNFSKPATKYFRGRAVELERLVRIIREGKSAVIFGLQRVGKTSLIDKVLGQEIKAPSFPKKVVTLSIDMFSAWQSFNTDLDLIFAISDQLASAIQPDDEPTRVQDATRKFFHETPFEADRQKRFKTFLQTAANRTGASILLFIDEFHDIQRTFERSRQRKTPNPVDAGLIRWFTSMVKDGTLQVLLCCRYKGLAMEKEEKLELFKLLEQIKLGMLDETSARELIRDPVGGGIRYEEQSVKRILELTGSHPYLIQYLCSELLSAGKVVRSRLVRPRDVEDCADMIVQDPTNDPKFDVLYEDFQTMDHGLPWKALLVLAECAGDQAQVPVPFERVEEMWKGHFGTSAALGRALAALGMSEIVAEERMGKQSRYWIKSHLLRLWLAARRYIDRVY